MGQKPTFEQVMRLVDQLTPDERELILDQLKMEKLKGAIQVGIDQADRGDLIDGDEVFRLMRQRNAGWRGMDSQ